MIMIRMRMRHRLRHVARVVVVRVAGDGGRLHVASPGRANHGRGHRAPDRERDGEQDQEPDTERFHGDEVSTGEKPIPRS